MPRMVPVHWRDLERVILRSGFEFRGQVGSHRTYTRQGTARPVVIPAYDQVPVSIVRNNLKTAGISRERYFELLAE